MYNVPTYTKFGLHRVPRMDHRRKSRTPCIVISFGTFLHQQDYKFGAYIFTALIICNHTVILAITVLKVVLC